MPRWGAPHATPAGSAAWYPCSVRSDHALPCPSDVKSQAASMHPWVETGSGRVGAVHGHPPVAAGSAALHEGGHGVFGHARAQRLAGDVGGAPGRAHSHGPPSAQLCASLGHGGRAGSQGEPSLSGVVLLTGAAFGNRTHFRMCNRRSGICAVPRKTTAGQRVRSIGNPGRSAVRGHFRARFEHNFASRMCTLRARKPAVGPRRSGRRLAASWRGSPGGHLGIRTEWVPGGARGTGRRQRVKDRARAGARWGQVGARGVLGQVWLARRRHIHAAAASAPSSTGQPAASGPARVWDHTGALRHGRVLVRPCTKPWSAYAPASPRSVGRQTG